MKYNKAVAFMAIFVGLVILVQSAIYQRKSLRSIDEEFEQRSMFYVMFNKEQMLGTNIEVVGYVGKFSEIFFYLFVDEKRAKMHDYSSTIAFETNDANFRKYLRTNCLGKWVRIRGRLTRREPHFSAVETYLMVVGISDLALKQKNSSYCNYNYL